MSDERYQQPVEQRRTKFMARWAARKHQEEKARTPDGLNHAVLNLKGAVPGRDDFGKLMLIGCVCGHVWWRNKHVTDEQVQGDWAKAFRERLGVKSRPNKKDLRGRS